MTDICKRRQDLGFWVVSDTYSCGRNLMYWSLTDSGTFFYITTKLLEIFCKIQNERIQKQKPS